MKYRKKPVDEREECNDITDAMQGGSQIHSAALDDVLAERKRQDEKWGQQDHPPVVWLAILMEEVGEASHDVLEARFVRTYLKHLRTEVVQVAAVAIGFLECLDRGEWQE